VCLIFAFTDNCENFLTAKISWYTVGTGRRSTHGTYEAYITFGNYGYYTLLVVLTVAPSWRSFLITLEWPLEDAIISAVAPFCEEMEGAMS